MSPERATNDLYHRHMGPPPLLPLLLPLRRCIRRLRHRRALPAVRPAAFVMAAAAGRTTQRVGSWANTKKR